MEDMKASSVARKNLCINTKIGRYEQDPKLQFDFSYKATLASCRRSVERMQCGYIDVLQLHDPEFAPSLEVLLNETVPAMVECRKKGYCKALGMTGYPLQTQYQIISRALELSGDCGVLDQSLTYGHYNLFNTSLFDQPIQQYSSFADFCKSKKICLMAAAPLSMGLLTKTALADWHPASNELVSACKEASVICDEQGVDIATLAVVFALSNPHIPCTILGMKSVEEVKYAVSLAHRFHDMDQELETMQEGALKRVFTDNEYKAFLKLRDRKQGPFAAIWESGKYTWDGISEARKFWEQMEGAVQVDWHLK